MKLRHFENREGRGEGLWTYTTQHIAPQAILEGRHNKNCSRRDLHQK